MHGVYPHECSYPHLSGTTQPRRPDEFEEDTDQDATATEEEMLRLIQEGRQHRSNTAAFDEVDGACSSMWTMEEELVVPGASLAGDAPVAESNLVCRLTMRCAAVTGAVASLLLALKATLGPAIASWANEGEWQAASKNDARLRAPQRIHSV